MDTFSALLAIYEGNSPAPGEFPLKGQWRGALMFSLICVWIKGWENNLEAGDFRRYHAHYDIIVMSMTVMLYEHDFVSNHRRFDCLLNRLFRRRSKKTSKLRVIGLCEGNSPVTGEFPAQRASNAENASIWCRHHAVRSPAWRSWYGKVIAST